jgi:hypothetical protein
VRCPDCFAAAVVRTDGDDSKARLQPIDIVVIVAVVLMVVAGVFVLLKTICSKVRCFCPLL